MSAKSKHQAILGVRCCWISSLMVTHVAQRLTWSKLEDVQALSATGFAARLVLRDGESDGAFVGFFGFDGRENELVDIETQLDGELQQTLHRSNTIACALFHDEI
jgi:hypothetical protein